jgi:hypothetical protein
MSKNNDLSETNVCIGINTINRVFEYTLVYTKCIEKTKYYAQRSYYYYLEYIEQIGDLYLSQGLNHMDAVLFVYKKTIFDLESDSENQSVNMLAMNTEPILSDADAIGSSLLKIFKLINILMYWNNKEVTFLNRKTLCQSFLFKFLKKLDNVEIIYTYLEILQRKIVMNYSSYEKLLIELSEKKLKKNNGDNLEKFLFKFYIDESILLEKFESGNMKDFVKWLYSTN